jgi:putative acetyltransferase
MIQYLRSAYSDPDFLLLVEALDQEFVVRYPSLKNTFHKLNAMNENARVILAYADDKPVACGAFRPYAQKVIEIKRMYTLPSFRNRGIGGNVLRELEQWAREEGFTEAILETGIHQPEAMAAYRKAGYRSIPNFPPYENVEISRCFGKKL